MAGVNRVEFGNEVIIDLTNDTVTPGSLLSGFTAHDANGDVIVGTASGLSPDLLGALAYLDVLDYNSSLLINKPLLGELSKLSALDYNSSLLINKPLLGELSKLSALDYNSSLLINKPLLGELSKLNTLDYKSDLLINKPLLGELSKLSALDYNSNLLFNKPLLGELSKLNVLDYKSDLLINKPESHEDFLEKTLNRIGKYYSQLPLEIFIGAYISSEVLCMPDSVCQYINTSAVSETLICNSNSFIDFAYDSDKETIVIKINRRKHGDLAYLDFLDYQSEYLINKPLLGELSKLNALDYNSNLLINKPESHEDFLEKTLEKIKKYYPQLPLEITLAAYISSEILCMPDDIAEYVDTEAVSETLLCKNESFTKFFYGTDDESLIIKLIPKNSIPEAPLDGNFYVRQNGDWVSIELISL